MKVPVTRRQSAGAKGRQPDDELPRHPHALELDRAAVRLRHGGRSRASAVATAQYRHGRVQTARTACGAAPRGRQDHRPRPPARRGLVPDSHELSPRGVCTRVLDEVDDSRWRSSAEPRRVGLRRVHLDSCSASGAASPAASPSPRQVDGLPRRLSAPSARARSSRCHNPLIAARSEAQTPATSRSRRPATPRAAEVGKDAGEWSAKLMRYVGTNWR